MKNLRTFESTSPGGGRPAVLAVGWGGLLLLAVVSASAQALPEPKEMRFTKEQIEAARAEDHAAPPPQFEGCIEEQAVTGGDWCPAIFNTDDAAHYVRGTTLIWHILVNHAGGGWNDTEISQIGTRSVLAREYYADHGPTNAYVRFDHEDEPGFYYYTPTLPYEIVVNGANWGNWVNDACMALGVPDLDGDGAYTDDLTVLLQSWGGGWDNVIAVFQPAELSFRANASVERAACQVPEGDSWEVYAHEWGHCFGACDEYEEQGTGECNGNLCDWICQSCYLTDDVPNGNCEVGGCSTINCIMKYQDAGGDEPPCPFTTRHWAWVDANDDGLLDPTLWNDAGTARNLYELYHNGYFIHTNTTWGMAANQRWTSWSAIGVRSRDTSNYQIEVFVDNNHRWELASSQLPGQEIDFVVGDFNHNNPGQDHIQLTKASGSGQYVLAYESGNEMLFPDGVERAGSWNDYNVVRTYDVPLIAGETIGFELDIDTAQLDLGMALFRSSGSTYYAGRAAAVWEEDDWPGGLSESYVYTVPTTDVYGLVIWANSEVDGAFSVQIGPTISTLAEATPSTNFLDLSLYRYVPYANYWAVSGTRPGPNTNVRLQLYQESTFQTLLATSGAYPGVEFIAADYNPGFSTDYLRVVRQTGVNSYATEWEQGEDLLAGFEDGNWGAGHVCKVWDAHLVAGQTYMVRQYETVGAPLDAGLYLMSSAGGNRYIQRSGAADGSTGGGTDGEWFLYTAPADDWYGVVLMMNDGSAGPYTVGIGPRVSLQPNVPVVLPDEVLWTDIPSSPVWAVTGVRTESGSESQPLIWSCPGFDPDCSVGDDVAGPGIRYLVLDGRNIPNIPYYPRFDRTSGTGERAVSYDDVSGHSLVFSDPGEVEIGQGSFVRDEVVQIWDLNMRFAPIRLEVAVIPLTTSLDVGVAVFEADDGIQPSYYAIAAGNEFGAGQAERVIVEIMDRSVFGLVITDENGAAGGYRIEVRDANAPSDVAAAALPRELVFRNSGSMPSTGPAGFELSLPARAHVQLGVFDIQGRRVRALLDQILEAGSHALVWDGEDESGHNASTGLYFARLVAGQESRTVKVVRGR